MRKARLLGEGLSHYHCMSRVVDKRFIFGDEEKRVFVGLMRKLEAFTGIRVLTWCVMSNHFHLLLEVPERIELSDEAVLERFARFRGTMARDEVVQIRELAGEAVFQEALEKLRRRTFDLSVFLKELKHGFTVWFNRKNERTGTLWEGRFKSILVESAPKALLTMAAYIDLNPVRAGLVENPKDYRWCGYGAACGGDATARQGVERLTVIGRQHDILRREESPKINWRSVHAEYRQWVYLRGEKRSTEQCGFSQEEVEAVIAARGNLPLSTALRCRVRYFSDGAILGSKSFVDSIYEKRLDLFGTPSRTSGARPMRFGDWGGLHTLRDLQKRVVEAPT